MRSLAGMAWLTLGLEVALNLSDSHLQVPLSQPPEEELERLTKKMVHDMSHPPSGEYFGELALGNGEEEAAGLTSRVCAD